MQHIQLSDRIKAFFARDEYAFWWNHFTDEEKKLQRMDVWELAKVINDARVRNLAGEAEKLIVSEHMLNMRLAQIQAKASWGSGALGFFGAIIGASLSVSLTMVLQNQKEAPSVQECTSERQAITTPVQEQPEPIAQPLKILPSKPVVTVTPSTQGTINGSQDGVETERSNAVTKP